MLDFRVNTFLEVCRCMNFTKAAEQLNITQPAVSQHIHFLENEYGVKLFYLEGKKIYLTRAGESLKTLLQQMTNDTENLKKKIKTLDSGSTKLSFGVTMTIGEYAIVPVLSRYLKSNPDTNIHIRYGNTTTLLKDLENGKIDFAIVEGYFPTEKYAVETFRTERFIAVCNKKHKFNKDVHKLSDLFSERLLVREIGSGTRNILERNLALQNYAIADFLHYIEVENMHTIHELLLADCGISFLYSIAVEKDLEKGILKEIELEDFNMKHDFTFIWPKESIFSDKIRQICKSFRYFSV